MSASAHSIISQHQPVTPQVALLAISQIEAVVLLGRIDERQKVATRGWAVRMLPVVVFLDLVVWRFVSFICQNFQHQVGELIFLPLHAVPPLLDLWLRENMAWQRILFGFEELFLGLYLTN
ncbi:hypothetical protein IWZ00DRAFT_203447 [Phyllosticta capitalensis]